MYGRNAHRKDAARQHPLRSAIIALLARQGGAMSAAEIRTALAGDPALGVVTYHLRVLGNLVDDTDGYYELR